MAGVRNERFKIRAETIDSATKKMGRIPGFTKIQREKLRYFPTEFTEVVRQSAYVLSRYCYESIYSSNKITRISDIIDEVTFVSFYDVEPYHILIALNMLSPPIYSILVFNDEPERIKLPLKLVKKALPPAHKYRPNSRYFCAKDDKYKESLGFSCIIETPVLSFDDELMLILKQHSKTIFDYEII